ncbi:2'-5' RNA ligase family protein [Aestuariimicrobium kwangyangense]|uniref:2'-5' RNA ligase family protein n=1 Tax=Aestuariimicrobium kwangyangense TaxID=396389 RepID=UPI0003B4783E|nr:2'-5' RNA ligase family protein [Aestuariimicrobium kwangyangense]
MNEWPGHAVLQVPCPPLESWVRARYRHYDASLVSSDPRHVHAHVTLLGPVPAELSSAQSAAVESICSRHDRFEVGLDRVATFPNGVVHVVPEPLDPFRRMTDELVAAFPDWPAYGGTFTPTPHITLDALSEQVSESSVAAEVAHLMGRPWRPDRVDLVWYRAHEVRVLRTWPLG